MILQRSRLIVQYCKSQGIERETSPSIFFMCYSKTCFYSSFLLGFGSSTVKLAEKVYGKIGGKKDLWLGLTVSYFFKLREIRSCTKQVTVSPSFDRFAKLKKIRKLRKKVFPVVLRDQLHFSDSHFLHVKKFILTKFIWSIFLRNKIYM